MNWELYKFPLNEEFVENLKSNDSNNEKEGKFFKGTFHLTKVADAWFDTSNYQKGVIWVNGHNLGRYWNIGPQTRLYCPASWLTEGENNVVIFDLHQIEAKTIK